METLKVVALVLVVVLVLFAIWNSICLRKKRQREEQEKSDAEFRKEAQSVCRKFTDHRLNVSNRIHNTLTAAAKQNTRHQIAVTRDEKDYITTVGIYEPARGMEYADFPGMKILQVQVRGPLPLGEFKGSSIKPIGMIFGPEKLKMYNNGTEEELAALVAFISKYVSDYSVQEVAVS